VEPDLRAGYSTLWFDRAKLRVWDNAHHLFCTMHSVVNVSQLKPAISSSLGKSWRRTCENREGGYVGRMDDPDPVLLFDGECGLCVRCVRFLLKADRGRRLRFAPLRGEAAQTFLRERGLSADNYESALFITDWGRRLVVAPLVRTDALIGAIGVMGSALSPLAWLKLFPRTWRDAAYRWVARNRLRIYGAGDVAELLREFGAERFILVP